VTRTRVTATASDSATATTTAAASVRGYQAVRTSNHADITVHITESPPGTSPIPLLRGRFAPEHGTFAVLIRPAEAVRGKRTRKTVAIPFFHALGKNLATVGSYTNQSSEFRSQIAHWFAAYDAQELVVFDAHAMFPATMAAIFEYAATVPRITFACEPGYGQRTRDAVHAAAVTGVNLGVTSTWLDWDTLVDRLPVAPTVIAPPPAPYTMRHLPVCDFLLFRNQARLTNEPAVFDAIDDDYRRAYTAALDVEPTLDAVVTMVAAVTREATDTAPIMVALRATQVALLARGWLLTAHQDKAMGTLCAIRPPNPTDAHWRSLHGYVRTQRVAGVALYLLNVAPDDLNTVTISDVEIALNTGVLGSTPIPDLARPLLKAQLHHRRSEGAEPGDGYLNQRGPRRHLEDLIDARRHLGIPIDARFLRNGTLTHTERPIWRFGLDLRNLT
jgi:hypothetical protein